MDMSAKLGFSYSSLLLKFSLFVRLFSQFKYTFEIFLFNIQAESLPMKQNSVAEPLMKFRAKCLFFRLYPVQNSVQNSVNFRTVLNF